MFATNFSEQLLEITTRITNRIISDTSIRNYNEQNAVNNSNNRMTVRIEDSNISGCPINISQQNNSFLTVIQDVNNDVSNDMLTDIENELANKLQQEIEQLIDGLGFGRNVSRQQTQINQSIDTVIQNTVRMTFQTILNSSSNANNDIDFTMRGLTCINSTIDVSQTALIGNMATQISRNVVDNLMKTDLINSIENDIEQISTQANIGLSLGGLFLIIIIGFIAFIMFKKFLLKFIIIIAVIAIVLIILYIILVVTGILPNPFVPKAIRSIN